MGVPERRDFDTGIADRPTVWEPQGEAEHRRTKRITQVTLLQIVAREFVKSLTVVQAGAQNSTFGDSFGLRRLFASGVGSEEGVPSAIEAFSGEGVLSTPIITRAEFQALAEVRLEEAKALLDLAKWDGSYYLAGYSIELALKACIIKKVMATDAFLEKKFSDECYTHLVKKLIDLAGLKVP